MAQYNLTLGKWVCPKPNPAPSQPSLENLQPARAGIFSLGEAQMLNSNANETNFNSVVQIITGIPLEPQVRVFEFAILEFFIFMSLSARHRWS